MELGQAGQGWPCIWTWLKLYLNPIHYFDRSNFSIQTRDIKCSGWWLKHFKCENNKRKCGIGWKLIAISIAWENHIATVILIILFWIFTNHMISTIGHIFWSHHSHGFSLWGEAPISQNKILLRTIWAHHTGHA